MKRYITAAMMMGFLAVAVTFFASDANAQTRRYYGNRTNTSQSYNRPSFYRRHRNAVNIGIATGAGALIGALIGGKKGALIGAGAGAGGGALYTYKIKPKKPRYYGYYR